MAVHKDGRLTYRQMQVQAYRAAKGMYALGVRPGDRISLLMTNRLEWLVTAFGAFQLAATVAPLSTWYRTWDIDQALRHSQARLLITLDRFRNNSYIDSIHELAPELKQQDRERLRLERFPHLERIVVFGSGSPPHGTFGYDEMLALGESIPDSSIAEGRAAGSLGVRRGIILTSEEQS